MEKQPAQSILRKGKDRKYDPEIMQMQSQFEDKELKSEDLESMETNQAGMISIADLLKKQSKPQEAEQKQIQEPQIQIQSKQIKFNEESIQELQHVNHFKKQDPSYVFTSDPKTPYQDDDDEEDIDPIAKENMLKNQAAFNMDELKVKLQPKNSNNEEFNKKRKNHYKNEFRKNQTEENKF